MVFITSQGNSLVDHLKQTIREYGIDWPILFYGDGDKVPQAEWQCRGNPIAFLINPQGVIVGHAFGAKNTPNLIDAYEFLSENPSIPPIGVRLHFDAGDETGGVMYLDLSNPCREEIKVEIDYRFLDFDFGEDGRFSRFERYTPNPDGPEEVLTVEFNGTSEMIVPVSIEAGIYEMVECKVRVMLPGTENLSGGRGIWTHQWAEIRFGVPDHCIERF